MRILSVIHELGPGGMERVCQNNATAFARRGHASAVFAHWRGGFRAEALERSGIPVFIGGADDEKFEQGLEESVGFRPDLLWTHGSGGADPKLARIIRAVRARARRPVRVITTSHFGRPDHSAERSLNDVHVQISEWGMWRWRQWTRLQRPPPLGIMVPHAVNVEAFFPCSADERVAFRARHGIPIDALLFGRFGQPDAVIWPTSLLETFARFAAGEPRAWLALVGAPPFLEQQRSRLPADIARRVVVMPFIFGDEHVRLCYGALDVFLHITRIGDTFGMVLCESMLCGVPVITLATPAKNNGHVEVVGHGIGGLVCASLRTVITAMREMSRDPELRTRLGKQGRESVLKRFAPERVADLNLAVAEAVQQSSDRTALERALGSIPGLTTQTTSRRIAGLEHNVIGSYPLADRLIAWLVGRPRLFASWLRLQELGAARRARAH
jgi:glycosyltransferase involved in cell wall biosynthesis